MEDIKRSNAYIFLKFSKIPHLDIIGVDEYFDFLKHSTLECALYRVNENIASSFIIPIIFKFFSASRRLHIP